MGPKYSVMTNVEVTISVNLHFFTYLRLLFCLISRVVERSLGTSAIFVELRFLAVYEFLVQYQSERVKTAFSVSK